MKMSISFRHKIILKTGIASVGSLGCEEKDFMITLLHNCLSAFTKHMECGLISSRGSSR